MKKSYTTGFTLVELLVSIFIIALLSAVIFANYRQSGQQFALQRSANKLAQDIRRAQEMTMSAKEFGGSVPPGYGVILDKTWDVKKYRLYADEGSEFFNPADTIVETIDLERGVIIKKIEDIDIPLKTYDSVSINFKPPDPIVNIRYNVGPPGLSETIITLSLETDQNKTKIISVNKAGLIEIE